MKKKSKQHPTVPGSALSARESQVLELLCAGYCGKRITRALGISQTTISEYTRRIKVRTGCQNAYQLGAWAAANLGENPLAINRPVAQARHL